MVRIRIHGPIQTAGSTSCRRRRRTPTPSVGGPAGVRAKGPSNHTLSTIAVKERGLVPRFLRMAEHQCEPESVSRFGGMRCGEGATPFNPPSQPNRIVTAWGTLHFPIAGFEASGSPMKVWIDPPWETTGRHSLPRTF